jgi:microcystin-dependent protein
MGLGEIRLFAGKYAPADWAFCNGAMLQIQEYRDLFKELGTRYGGDGRTNFALPDLRSRAPMHRADGAALGTKGQFNVDIGRPHTPARRMALNFIIAVKHSNILETHEPYIGEIRPFAFHFTMQNWQPCNGKLLPLQSEYYALFSILDTAFGGDGQRTFAVPDLQGMYPFQPQKPEDRAQTGGAQVLDRPSSQTPLLTVNYCIALTGYYPGRGN